MLRQLTLALVLLAKLPAQDAAVFVEVTGAVKQPLKLGSDDLAKAPRASVKPQGEALRGKALAGYALAGARRLPDEVVQLRK